MIQQRDRLRRCPGPEGRDRRWPLDYHHRQAKGPCGSDLAVGGRAAAVLADDHLDLPRAQELYLGCLIKGPARQQRFQLRQLQGRLDRIDAAHQILMLRRCLEGSRLLPADGQKHALWRCAKGRHGRLDRGDLLPPVARFGLPCRPLQSDQRHTGQPCGCRGVLRDLPGKGMGRIDQHVDGMLAEIGCQPLRTAEAARPGRGRQGQGIAGAPGERQGERDVAARRKLFGQLARFGRARQNEDVTRVQA